MFPDRAGGLDEGACAPPHTQPLTRCPLQYGATLSLPYCTTPAHPHVQNRVRLRRLRQALHRRTDLAVPFHQQLIRRPQTSWQRQKISQNLSAVQVRRPGLVAG